jgi:ribosomal protein L31
LECSCGEEFECPSNQENTTCQKCLSVRNIEDALKSFYVYKKSHPRYYDKIRSKAESVKRKFNQKYGNVEDLAKKLKMKKRG